MAISWGTTLYQLAIFIILLFLLRRYAFGPILNLMQQRQEKVESELAHAEKSRQEAEKLLAEQREALNAARQEAKEIIDRAVKNGEHQGEELIRKAREEAERLKEDAITEIKREKEQALAELRDQIGTLSVMIASKIIEKELDESAQKALVDEYIQEVREQL